jgi:hypothetical protein
MDEDIFVISVASLIAFVFIVCYGTYTHCIRRTKDRLHNGTAFDAWGISHLLFYGTLAFAFPHRATLLFAMGLAWEALEYHWSVHPIAAARCDREDIRKIWYARWEDIAWNALGILLGVLVHFNFRP